MPNISFIIVTWNSSRDITNCLNSVFSQKLDNIEVIIIDNASQDDTIELLQKRSEKLTLICNNRNLGFAWAVNQGLSAAAGKYLVILNPDTVIQPDAVKKMLLLMDSDLKIGALGPQLLNTDGTIQPSCREFPRPVHLFYEFSGLSKIFPRHHKFGSWRMGYFDHQSSREVDQPMGACLMVRKSAIEQIGQMDAANFPMFFNEVDWCFRLRQRGWKIVFSPEARVVHLQGVSIKKARLAMTISSHRSLAAFFGKHYPGKASTFLAKLALLIALPFRLSFQSLRTKRIFLGS